MTMNVVLGNGLMPNKELQAHLQDLMDKDNADEQNHWYLVQTKAEPTSTDEALMQFLHDNEIYYETIGDGSEPADIYVNAQEKHVVKRLAPKIVSLMQEKPEEEEDAILLALFASDDLDAEEDRWLNDVISAVSDAGYKTYGLNDGMVLIDLEEVEGGEMEAVELEDEEVIPPAPAKKAAAKKAATKLEGVEEVIAATGSFTREALEEMDLGKLKEIAAKLGITLPPRTRMGTYIDAILGEREEEEAAEVEVENIEEPEPVANTGSTTTGRITLLGGALEAPAMVIVVLNGKVTARSVSAEEALSILS